MLFKAFFIPIIFTGLVSKASGELSNYVGIDRDVDSTERHNPSDELTGSLSPRGAPKCTPGTYSSTGTTPCIDCSPGTYSKEAGSTSCIAARAGYYVPTAKATTEVPCSSGSHSTSVGATTCSSCPAGYMCPSNALASPQSCSPGRYSTGGATDCSKCSAGTFNNIQGATGCCYCAAGWYNDQPGNTNCQRCSNQYPYSAPGAAGQNACSAKPNGWAISASCAQNGDGGCPGSSPMASVSSLPKRHVMHAPLCRRTGQKACPVLGYNWRGGHHLGSYTSYECVDIENDLESCGGCITHSADGEKSADGGRDCSAIPNISTVRCHRGQCLIDLCKAGFIKSADGGHCHHQKLPKNIIIGNYVSRI